MTEPWKSTFRFGSKWWQSKSDLCFLTCAVEPNSDFPPRVLLLPDSWVGIIDSSLWFTVESSTTPWIIQVGDNDLPTLRIDHGCLVKDICGNSEVGIKDYHVYSSYICLSLISMLHVLRTAHVVAMFFFLNWMWNPISISRGHQEESSQRKSIYVEVPISCHEMPWSNAHASTRICMKITDITWILSSWGLKKDIPWRSKKQMGTWGYCTLLKKGPITPVHLLQDWEIWFNFDFNLSPVFLFDRKRPTKQGG